MGSQKMSRIINPKPMVYTAQMVPLIMADLKTQSRRIMRIQPDEVLNGKAYMYEYEGEVFDHKKSTVSPLKTWKEIKPPHQSGDIAYVAEGYQIDSDFGYLINYERTVAGIYTAGRATFLHQLTPHEWKLFSNRKKPHAKTSGRFMYASLARTWLEILGVKAERIQDISEEDAKAEGAKLYCWGVDEKTYTTDPVTAFRYPACYKNGFSWLWNSIHGPNAWKRDDWIWAYKLERCEKP